MAALRTALAAAACLAAVQRPAGAKDRLAHCAVGDEWVSGHVKYRCEEDSETNTGHIRPIGCVPYSGKAASFIMVLPGTTWRDDDYKHECVRDGADTLEWNIVACFTPAGVYMSIGDMVYEDDGYYECRLNEQSTNHTVEIVWIKDPRCEYEDEMYDIAAWWRVGDSVYKCSLGPGLQPVGQVQSYGCYLPSGRWINSWQADEGYLCACWKEPVCVPEEDPTRCAGANEIEYKLGETYTVGPVEYSCDLKRGTGKREAHGKAKNCLVYTSDGGQVRVPVNQAAKVDGDWYHCVPKAQGAKKTFEPVPIPDDKTECVNGRELEEQWVEDGVHWHCCLRDGLPTLVALQCVSAEYTAVAKNKVKFYDTEAWICLPDGESGLKYEKLTDAEFALFKYGDSTVRRTGIVGTGVKWILEDGTPVMCEHGYELADKECIDINECQRGAHDCAERVERCLNKDGGYRCICARGYARRVDEEPSYCIEPTCANCFGVGTCDDC